MIKFDSTELPDKSRQVSVIVLLSAQLEEVTCASVATALMVDMVSERQEDESMVQLFVGSVSPIQF